MPSCAMRRAFFQVVGPFSEKILEEFFAAFSRDFIPKSSESIVPNPSVAFLVEAMPQNEIG